MKIRNILAGAVLALCSIGTANAGIITIDDFSTDQGPLFSSVGSPAFSSVTSVFDDILGGERDLMIQTFRDDFGQGSSVNVSNGFFFFSSGSGVESQFTIQWDGVDGSMGVNPFGLGGVNFTGVASGFTSFITSIVEADLNAWFDVTFWSGDQGTSETVELPIPGVNAPGRDAFFTTSVFQNTDFTNVGAIQVRGNIISPDTGMRVRSYDLQLDGVTAVPEPSGVLLFGLGAIGLALAGRRRKQV